MPPAYQNPEEWHSGKPVVLTVNREARRILEESGGGVYVPADNPWVLAQKILELSKDRERLTEMGRQGRAYVLNHFTRDIQANVLEQVLLNLTDRSTVSRQAVMSK